MNSLRDELAAAIRANQSSFQLELSNGVIERLAGYYEIVMEHNHLLHLVGPCSAEEFATRHVLESLSLFEYLPKNSRFADVGAGAGLPSIPCLIAREDLRATLIESKEKKAVFLSAAVDRLGLATRATIVNRQFSETDAGDAQFVTCRALDKLVERLPKLVSWSGKRKMLLFGGENLRDALQSLNARFAQKLMPLSERRFLYVVE